MASKLAESSGSSRRWGKKDNGVHAVYPFWKGEEKGLIGAKGASRPNWNRYRVKASVKLVPGRASDHRIRSAIDGQPF